MSPEKLVMGVLLAIALAVAAYFFEEELFDFMTDPGNQVEVRRNIGITKVGEERP